ncbi:hypothetical protein [Bacteroides acidifaciens]|uniref:Uncharacterized protein n=1 Tax=Bacteroides acidifaciens TaxID=85831 RepID=A0A4S2B0E9_9BACE|nr:hypothetical protein [Bacteroides acidifaciens]TGY07113.1 hypothetical protein E5356_05135 [Bacteroides acidifaciens]
MIKKFLKFRYTAIRRYGEKTWTAKNGVIEFNPNYTVSCSTCEKEFSSDRDTAYIVELSNGTKFLCFMRGYFGATQIEELLSEEGEQANIENDQQANADRTRRSLYLLNGR